MSGTTAALYLLRKGDYIPQFDAARAVRVITQADSHTALETAWFSITLDYEMSERQVEPVVREAYQTQRAMIVDVNALVLRDSIR